MNRGREMTAALIACIGGFLQSYVTCIIAGALLFIAKEFHLTPLQEGTGVGVILLGALVGSLGTGYLADRLGRRKSILLSALLYCLGSGAILFVFSFFWFLFFRFLTGLAVGMTSLLLPLYLAEIAPPARRGAFVTLYQTSITVGTLIAYLINFSLLSSEDWRMMLSLAALPAALQLAAFFFLPESPKWLAREEVPTEEKKTLFHPLFRWVLVLGIALSIFQQLTGINAVVYFTPKIFAEAGFASPKSMMLATLMIGVANFLATFYSIFLIDRVGRKKLILMSLLGVILSLISFVWAFTTEIRFADLLAVLALMIYISSYSVGLGPVTWVVISEIYPLAIRAKAIAVMTFLSWLSNYGIVVSFPLLLSIFGSPLTFALYIALACIALLFFWRYLPETKGKSLEEIEVLLISKHRERD